MGAWLLKYWTSEFILNNLSLPSNQLRKRLLMYQMQVQRANPYRLALIQLSTPGYFCQGAHSPPSYQAEEVCYEIAKWWL